MAFNVWFTIYRQYSAQQLRSLEKYYFIFAYGIPFIPSFILFFIKDPMRGSVYGDAVVSHSKPNSLSTLTSFDSYGAGLPRIGTTSELPYFMDLSGKLHVQETMQLL
jgi:hypothetical protein